MMCFSPFILFMWHITLINFLMLSHPCIPGMHPIWSWHIICLICCWFCLLVFFFWGFLHQYSSKILVCNFFQCLWFWYQSRMGFEGFPPPQLLGTTWGGLVLIFIYAMYFCSEESILLFIDTGCGCVTYLASGKLVNWHRPKTWRSLASGDCHDKSSCRKPLYLQPTTHRSDLNPSRSLKLTQMTFILSRSTQTKQSILS